MVIMRGYDNYLHFIEKETHLEKGGNLFRVIPLGSGRDSTQVCLLPNHSAPEKYCEGIGERLLTRTLTCAHRW